METANRMGKPHERPSELGGAWDASTDLRPEVNFVESGASLDVSSTADVGRRAPLKNADPDDGVNNLVGHMRRIMEHGAGADDPCVVLTGEDAKVFRERLQNPLPPTEYARGLAAEYWRRVKNAG